MHGDWNLFFPFYHLLSLAFELSVSQDFLREVVICLFVIAARELQDVICTVFFPVSFFFCFFCVGLFKRDRSLLTIFQEMMLDLE